MKENMRLTDPLPKGEAHSTEFRTMLKKKILTHTDAGMYHKVYVANGSYGSVERGTLTLKIQCSRFQRKRTTARRLEARPAVERSPTVLSDFAGRRRNDGTVVSRKGRSKRNQTCRAGLLLWCVRERDSEDLWVWKAKNVPNCVHTHDVFVQRWPTTEELSVVAAIVGASMKVDAHTTRKVRKYLNDVHCDWVHTTRHVEALVRQIRNERIAPSGVPPTQWVNRSLESQQRHAVSDSARLLAELLAESDVGFVAQLKVKMRREPGTTRTTEAAIVRKFGKAAARVLRTTAYESANADVDVRELFVETPPAVRTASGAGQRGTWLIEQAVRVSRELAVMFEAEEVNIVHIAWMHPHQLEEFSRFPECLSVDGTSGTNRTNYTLLLLCSFSSTGVFVPCAAFVRSESQEAVTFVHRALMYLCRTSQSAAAQAAVRNVRILMSDAGLGLTIAHRGLCADYSGDGHAEHCDCELGLCAYVHARNVSKVEWSWRCVWVSALALPHIWLIVVRFFLLCHCRWHKLHLNFQRAVGGGGNAAGRTVVKNVKRWLWVICTLPLKEQFAAHKAALLKYISTECQPRRDELGGRLTSFVEAQCRQRAHWVWAFMRRAGTMFLRTSSWNEGQNSNLKKCGLCGAMPLSTAYIAIRDLLSIRHRKKKDRREQFSVRLPSEVLQSDCDASTKVVLTTMLKSKFRDELRCQLASAGDLEAEWTDESTCWIKQRSDATSARACGKLGWMSDGHRATLGGSPAAQQPTVQQNSPLPWQNVEVPTPKRSLVKLVHCVGGPRLVCLAIRSHDGSEQRACDFFRETGLPCGHMICANGGTLSVEGIPRRWRATHVQQSDDPTTPRSPRDLHLGLPLTARSGPGSSFGQAERAFCDEMPAAASGNGLDNSQEDCYSAVDDGNDTAPDLLYGDDMLAATAARQWMSAWSAVLPTTPAMKSQVDRFVRLRDKASPLQRVCTPVFAEKFCEMVRQLQGDHPGLRFSVPDASPGFGLLRATVKTLAVIAAVNEELTRVVTTFLDERVRDLEAYAPPLSGRGHASNCEPWVHSGRHTPGSQRRQRSPTARRSSSHNAATAAGVGGGVIDEAGATAIPAHTADSASASAAAPAARGGGSLETPPKTPSRGVSTEVAADADAALAVEAAAARQAELLLSEAALARAHPQLGRSAARDAEVPFGCEGNDEASGSNLSAPWGQVRAKFGANLLVRACMHATFVVPVCTPLSTVSMSVCLSVCMPARMLYCMYVCVLSPLELALC